MRRRHFDRYDLRADSWQVARRYQEYQHVSHLSAVRRDTPRALLRRLDVHDALGGVREHRRVANDRVPRAAHDGRGEGEAAREVAGVEGVMSLSIYLEKVRPTVVYETNVTHNLNKMADEAGIYKHLWRPEEIGITKAGQLVHPLIDAISLMTEQPQRFIALNLKNGWGSYE